MIPSYFDEYNRIRFKEDLLLEEISGETRVPDFEYVKRCMFPSFEN